MLQGLDKQTDMVRISDNGPSWTKAKRLSSVNHTIKTIHHHHHKLTTVPSTFSKKSVGWDLNKTNACKSITSARLID